MCRFGRRWLLLYFLLLTPPSNASEGEAALLQNSGIYKCCVCASIEVGGEECSVNVRLSPRRLRHLFRRPANERCGHQCNEFGRVLQQKARGRCRDGMVLCTSQTQLSWNHQDSFSPSSSDYSTPRGEYDDSIPHDSSSSSSSVYYTPRGASDSEDEGFEAEEGAILSSSASSSSRTQPAISGGVIVPRVPVHPLFQCEPDIVRPCYDKTHEQLPLVTHSVGVVHVLPLPNEQQVSSYPVTAEHLTIGRHREEIESVFVEKMNSEREGNDMAVLLHMFGWLEDPGIDPVGFDVFATFVGKRQSVLGGEDTEIDARDIRIMLTGSLETASGVQSWTTKLAVRAANAILPKQRIMRVNADEHAGTIECEVLRVEGVDIVRIRKTSKATAVFEALKGYVPTVRVNIGVSFRKTESPVAQASFTLDGIQIDPAKAKSVRKEEWVVGVV